MNYNKVIAGFDDDVIYLGNLREVDNLPAVRKGYNTIVFCRGGRIVVEVGGNSQVKVTPGQLLLIPTGKLIQPMLVSADVEASALLVSDTILKSVLGSQITIWNKAMYMKEIYVVEDASWLAGMRDYSLSIFGGDNEMHLYREIIHSFLRTMLLMICEKLLGSESMTSSVDDVSTMHDKELFNAFLQLLAREDQKRQRVSYYADKLNITPKYLSTVCKKVSGKNPMRWIAESVMQDCYSLLKETDLSVKEISNLLGFPNASFFGQYFREQTGQTPVEFRTDYKTVV